MDLPLSLRQAINCLGFRGLTQPYFEYVVYSRDQTRHLRPEARMADLERLAQNEGPQARRQISRLRQYRSVNQYRNYPDVPLQGCLDLNTNEILRIVDPPDTLGV